MKFSSKYDLIHFDFAVWLAYPSEQVFKFFLSRYKEFRATKINKFISSTSRTNMHTVSFRFKSGDKTHSSYMNRKNLM